jgi:clusterin-associated protein 1
MSYREQRNFIEILRNLGYQHTISFDSFKQPNFVLVADILFFLITRYDPTLRLSDEISTESERVNFLTSIAEVMATKMRIKLNTKKLYGADGYAVKEMLKIASMLDQAIKLAATDEDEAPAGAIPALTSKVGDIRRCRQLATEITTQGAKLYDLLKQEEANREARLQVVGSDLDLDRVANNLRGQIATVTESVGTVERQIADIASDESNLEAKIEKKRADLERNQQRLKSLTTVRPAFMDEYEQIENDLRVHYAEYLEKYRNMTYLEHQLDRHMAAEQQEVEEAAARLRKMQARLREEDAAILRNGRWGGGGGGGGGGLGAGRKGFAMPGGHVDGGLSGDSDSDTGSSDRDGEVSRPFPSWNRSILTEIYLCHACSCQEILRAETAGQVEMGPGADHFDRRRGGGDSDDSGDLLGSDGDSMLSSDEDEERGGRGGGGGGVGRGRMDFDADLGSESSSSGSDPFGGDDGSSSAGSSLARGDGSGDSDSDNEF